MKFMHHLAACLLLCAVSSKAQQFVFDWADYGAPISDVEAGDSFTIANVDNSGVDFTFTFTQSLDSRTVNDLGTFNTIISSSNLAPDFPANVTGNTNFEGVYSSTPLYVVGESYWEEDSIILDITTSSAVTYTDLIIGDIDRLIGNQVAINTFEDRLIISSFLDSNEVDVNITSTSSTITVDNINNIVEATSGGLLVSNIPDSQIRVSTNSGVNRLRITYRNGDASSPGSAVTGDGWSDSHHIVLGTDAQLTRFDVIPEPSAFVFIACAGIFLLFNRRW